ncbi:MAG: winged helix-turn-helix transcriptional regulator [Microbacteriaceae bacterium]|nr:winged helix-turn-helix transcriptional regulator [Cryobacterium sp.]MCC6375395.1 winged helix-turn-helix transcriptional regulator [Microbacteriaceae bacterium]
MADIFDVIADPTRRDILQRLFSTGKTTELSVTELVDALELSQPTVSKHLKVLRDAGLVSVREDGQHRFYRLETEPLEELEDWLESLLPSFHSNSSSADQTVFAAWSGSELPEPLRRVADRIEHSADAGKTLGRKAAEASHQVRTVVEGAVHAVEDASSKVEEKIIEPLRRKLSKRDK